MPVLGIAGNIITKEKRKRTNAEWRKLHPNKKKKGKRVNKRTVIIKKQPIQPLDGKYRNYQLYALELQDNCYYVGMTSYADVNKRYKQHVSSKGGSKWTKLHRPIRVIETRQVGFVRDSESAKKENDMTLEYIMKYGIKYVRGGGICQVDILMADRYYKQSLRRKNITLD